MALEETTAEPCRCMQWYIRGLHRVSDIQLNSVSIPPTSKTQVVHTWSLRQMTLSLKVLSHRQVTEGFNTNLPNQTNNKLFLYQQRTFMNRTRYYNAPCRIRARPGVHMKPWQKITKLPYLFTASGVRSGERAP